MSAKSNSMKGFYRQKKKNNSNVKGSIAKSKSSKPIKNPCAEHAATFGFHIQTSALVSYGGSLELKDDYDEQEKVLRQFDMNMAYGRCHGITRLARWERAQRLGLNPLKDIENLLKGGKVKCLLDGRV